jgi:hypothetical protein
MGQQNAPPDAPWGLRLEAGHSLVGRRWRTGKHSSQNLGCHQPISVIVFRVVAVNAKVF